MTFDRILLWIILFGYIIPACAVSYRASRALKSMSFNRSYWFRVCTPLRLAYGWPYYGLRILLQEIKDS